MNLPAELAELWEWHIAHPETPAEMAARVVDAFMVDDYDLTPPPGWEPRQGNKERRRLLEAAVARALP